MPKPDFSKHC